MTGFVITPRHRRYWIEALDDDGSRRPVESFANEEAAVTRLRQLNERQDAIEQRKALHAQVPPSWQPAGRQFWPRDEGDTATRRSSDREKAAA